MKFFLDTANLNEIKKAKELGILDGVTTNPSLISKESIFNEKQIKERYLSICDILDDKSDISAEVINTDYKGIIKEGENLSSLNSKIVVKIPMTKDGIKSIKYFTKKKIKTNCTLVFSLGQAIIAAKAGSKYVSPFIGRLDDLSYNGIKLLEDIQKIYNNYKIKTKIIAASIRNPIHIIKCMKIGIYAITSPLNIILSLIKNPLTNIGLDKFLNDYHHKYKK